MHQEEHVALGHAGECDDREAGMQSDEDVDHGGQTQRLLVIEKNNLCMMEELCVTVSVFGPEALVFACGSGTWACRHNIASFDISPSASSQTSLISRFFQLRLCRVICGSESRAS